MRTQLVIKSLGLSFAMSALLLGLPNIGNAQAIYKIVGPDGRISFSDKPPTGAEKATALGASGRSTDSAAAAGLPFEVREAMTRYPVTLYTGNDCPPCGTAREVLNQRGVPYTEKTITTAQDVEALKRLGIEPSVPVLSVGPQKLKGLSESEWNWYLDAAGYPKTARLPSGYRNPAPTALVPTAENAAAAKPSEGASTPTAPTLPPPSGPTPSNPAGIVF